MPIEMPAMQLREADADAADTMHVAALPVETPTMQPTPGTGANAPVPQLDTPATPRATPRQPGQMPQVHRASDADTPGEDASVAPEARTAQTSGMESQAVPDDARQPLTDSAALARPIAEQSRPEHDATPRQTPEPAMAPHTMRSPSAEPADRAADVVVPASVAAKAQPEATPDLVAAPSPQAPPANPPTAAHGPAVEPPTEPIIGTPTATLPQDSPAPVAPQPVQDETARPEPSAQSPHAVNEIRQARRRPVMPAAARPPEPPAAPAPQPQMSEEEREKKRAQIARLRRMYFGDAADEAPAPQPVHEPPATIATPETPEAAVALPATAAETPAPSTTAVAVPAVIRDAMPTPITLPDATRRFLRPLVGFDPRDVPVYRDTTVNPLTAGHNADAVTDGDAILVAPANMAMERPETFGLLAHELTHVARRQRPRFVPPIARTGAEASRNPTIIEERGGERAASLTEESLAERVEERVIRAARSAPLAPPRVSPPMPEIPGAEAMHHQPSSGAAASQAVRPDRNWGDLPAPWEAVPDWMRHGPAESGDFGGDTRGTTMQAGQRAPVVQRAEVGRSLDERHEDHPHGTSDEGVRGAEPDLDALARQVYTILKQRLAVERRRIG